MARESYEPAESTLAKTEGREESFMLDNESQRAYFSLLPAEHGEIKKIILDNTPSTKHKAPKIIWWSIVPSFLIAVSWAGDFVSNKLSHDGPQALDELVSVISFAIFFGFFFILVWTPILGFALIVCLLLRAPRTYYTGKVWLIFGVLLLPFLCCFSSFLALPTMDAYRQDFHLHQRVNARLSESQVIALTKQAATDHGWNLEDYLPPDAVFYAKGSSPFPSYWQILYLPKPPATTEKKAGRNTIFIKVDDKTGHLYYRD